MTTFSNEERKKRRMAHENKMFCAVKVFDVPGSCFLSVFVSTPAPDQTGTRYIDLSCLALFSLCVSSLSFSLSLSLYLSLSLSLSPRFAFFLPFVLSCLFISSVSRSVCFWLPLSRPLPAHPRLFLFILSFLSRVFLLHPPHARRRFLHACAYNAAIVPRGSFYPPFYHAPAWRTDGRTLAVFVEACGGGWKVFLPGFRGHTPWMYA